MQAQVKDMVGPGQESMQALLAEHGPGSFDFVFIGGCKFASGLHHAALPLLPLPCMVPVQLRLHAATSTASLNSKCPLCCRRGQARVLGVLRGCAAAGAAGGSHRSGQRHLLRWVAVSEVVGLGCAWEPLRLRAGPGFTSYQHTPMRYTSPPSHNDMHTKPQARWRTLK